MKPRIIVTGASGRTGSVVGGELLEAGGFVRAVVHREDGRSAAEGTGGPRSLSPR
jgi:NAD(P)H dehydrogenase (quinone)